MGQMLERYGLERETRDVEASLGSPSLSGAGWVKKFPTSRSIQALDPNFREKVLAFARALKSAGADIKVTSTRRPRNRAYLMHWAWSIVKEGFDPRKVPPREGVDIVWWHGDEATSRAAAEEMVRDYGIGNLKVPPSLTSRHIDGRAIDMKVSWKGELEIARKDRSVAVITSTPRNHTNPDLIKVAETYEVIHFRNVSKDPVHWSVDGR